VRTTFALRIGYSTFGSGIMNETAWQGVAIVGMAGRLPDANNLEEFWRLVHQGRCASRRLPPDRFDHDLLFHPDKGVQNKSYTDLGCLVSYPDIDEITRKLPNPAAATPEICYMTLADIAYNAFEHAKWNPSKLPHDNIGVYIGHTRSSGLAGDISWSMQIAEVARYLEEVEQFQQLPADRREQAIEQIIAQVRATHPHRGPDGQPQLGANFAAQTISDAFRLTGPYMAFNSACASSFQALLQGVRALQLGKIDAAVVGSASYCHSDTFVVFSQAQSVSATGTRPFDADADGLIVGEGYIGLVLKLLDRAVADGDPIYGVIRGVGMSSDGKGKSLWAPRAEGQIEAVRRAYRTPEDMARLCYLEAHATSTQVGDATELGALAEAFSPTLNAAHQIPVGSAKGNVGHTLESAGLTGLLKTMLTLQHGIAPPAANVQNLNPKIDWENSPFFVPREPVELAEPADGGPRRAAVNAFGIGGLNVHVVLDGPMAPKRTMIGFPEPAGARQAIPATPFTPRKHVQEPIAIVGVGSVLPGARTFSAFWDLLRSGKQALSNVPTDRWKSDVYYRADTREPGYIASNWGGFITDFEYDWRKHKIPPKQIAQASPLQFMILDAVDQAFQSAEFGDGGFDAKRVGALVGTTFRSDFSSQLQIGLRIPQLRILITDAWAKIGGPANQADAIVDAFSQVLLSHKPALLDETGSFTSSSLASRITKSFNLMGGAAAVDAGRGSA